MVSSKRSCSDASASWKVMYFSEYRIWLRCPTHETNLRFRFWALLVPRVHAVLLVLAVADEDGHRDGARFPNSSQVTAGHGGTLPHCLKQALFLTVLHTYYFSNFRTTLEIRGPNKTRVLESLCQHFPASLGSKWISNYFQGESCLPRIIFVWDHLTQRERERQTKSPASAKHVFFNSFGQSDKDHDTIEQGDQTNRPCPNNIKLSKESNAFGAFQLKLSLV